jgi:hypothetical protein
MNQLLVSLGAQSGHRDATSCSGTCPIVGGPTPSTPPAPPAPPLEHPAHRRSHTRNRRSAGRGSPT